MNSLANFKLKENPFRLYPAISYKDITWAGFHDIQDRISKRIRRAIGMTNSTLVLNWGKYGSGKTHASRYFSKPEILGAIKNDVKSLPIVIDFPNSKQPTVDIYTKIIDKLDFESIFKAVRESNINVDEVSRLVTDNIFISNILRAMFATEGELGQQQPVLFQDNTNQVNPYILGYLHGTQRNAIEKFQRYGVSHFLASEDYAEFLGALFSFLTYEKKVYSCIILWIDEFEILFKISSTGTFAVNNFLRNVLDKTPNNLLLFMNLTLSTFSSVDDITSYLSESVKNRIKEEIEFVMPTKEQFKEYLSELLNDPLYRREEDVTDDKFFPFTESAIDQILVELGVTSLRRYNDVLSQLLELADLDGLSIIDKNYYEQNRNEILGVFANA